MFSHVFQRPSRRSFVIEFNPYQVLVAGISGVHRGPILLESAAEFDRDNLAGLRQWIDLNLDQRKTWTTAICGLVPRQGILQRESVQPERLADPNHLALLVREQHARRSLSSAPFQHVELAAWTLRAVGAVDGDLLPESGPARPALICGISDEEAHETQQRLLDHRLMPVRVEPALLSLIGALYRCQERKHDLRATILFVIRQESTATYILGKEGVHTPNSVPQGFSSIVQQARLEFGLKDDAAARERLARPDDEVRRRAGRLLRGLGADLKPVIDSYEMTTGQPVGGVYCAYLPPALAWIAEPLAAMVGHEPFTVDCQEWLPPAGLAAASGLPTFGPHWLGALSLISNLPEDSGLKTGKLKRVDPSYQRPWHLDCRRSTDLPVQRLVDPRFLTGAIAAALLGFVLLVAVWQQYVTGSLRRDTVYWEDQMARNQQLFEELTRSITDLRERTARIDAAYELMHPPYQLSEFLMSVGRSLPARMRIDRIEANDFRVALGGSLLEPAEEASQTLGRYMEGLRKAPEFAGLFTSISATSLQRESSGETLAFEITMRLKPPATR